MKKSCIVVAAAVLFSISFTVRADNLSDKQIIRLNEKANHLKNWNNVYSWYRNYGRYDDHNGEHAYSLNETVESLLTNRWSDLPTLISISKHDQKFWDFVLSYIDEAGDWDKIERISFNASRRCPTNAKSWCEAIIRTCADAKEHER